MSLLAAGPLGGPTTYLGWGWLEVSVPNLLVVLATVAVFALALLVPFPGHPDPEDRP